MDQDRRLLLKRLGLFATAAYVAPVVLNISNAHASGSESGGGSDSSGSGGSSGPSSSGGSEGPSSSNDSSENEIETESCDDSDDSSESACNS